MYEPQKEDNVGTEEPADEKKNIAYLETLLSFTASKKDANMFSVKLLNACGSLSSVFDAPYSILTEVGLTMNQAVLIKLVPSITRKYLDDKYFSPHSKSIIADFKSKVVTAFIGVNYEQILLVLRDSKDTELYFGIVSKGSVNASEIYIKKIIELALQYQASSAVIAHNHPSGIAFPSQRDVTSTIKIKNALSAVDIKLTDHLITAGNKAFSMAESEDFFDIFL